MRYFILMIVGAIFVGCSSAPIKQTEKSINRSDKRKVDTENCIIKLLNAGLSEELIYPMCKDIYERKSYRIKNAR